ncbi:formate dehydrogenase [Paucibacter sp. B2R-40]|uniref:formate dehydrogenase n=1 Tax=Paucibacter sp. B2R-40 TaxID=2893554 RepID=UPI0021E4D5F7|nr:formate dehydrogenase [Paucibacter sp. B2R-40]MCV2354250.1 formate dehydrogenase [Paucibacter sp. B2R-40]
MSMSKQQVTEKMDSMAASAPLKRRGWLLGLGAAGAAAVVAKALPVVAVEEQAPALAEKVAADTAGGYQLSPHVLRYYETARS